MNKLAVFLRESMATRALLSIGIILVVFGTFVFIANKKNQNYLPVEAVVSKTELVEEAHTDANGDPVEASYKVYVKYTVDGKEYEEVLGELSGYKKEQKVTIYYDPKDPSKITQTKSLVLPVVLIAAGVVSIVGGIVSGLNSIKKHKKMKEQERSWKDE